MLLRMATAQRYAFFEDDTPWGMDLVNREASMAHPPGKKKIRFESKTCYMTLHNHIKNGIFSLTEFTMIFELAKQKKTLSQVTPCIPQKGI